MSKCIRLGVFTFFTAFIFGFILCGESHATPGLDGIDKHDRHVNVIDVEKYLKQNPYKPPAKKPAPRPPVAKKTTPKPVAKPAAPKTVTVTQTELKKIVQNEVKKELQKEASKHPSFEGANQEAIQGFVQGALVGGATTIEFGGTGALPGALVGMASSYVGYGLKHLVFSD